MPCEKQVGGQVNVELAPGPATGGLFLVKLTGIPVVEVTGLTIQIHSDCRPLERDGGLLLEHGLRAVDGPALGVEQRQELGPGDDHKSIPLPLFVFH